MTDQQHQRAVSSLDDAIGVSVGKSHACALRSDATAMCWGSNDKGELGLAATNDSNEPHQINADNLAVIAAGSDVSCSIDHDGELLCWGRGYGSAPVQVAADGFRDVADNGHNVCGVHVDGWLACGDRSIGPRTESALVTDIVAIANNGSQSSMYCVEKRDAHVACWGTTQYGGTLGDRSGSSAASSTNAQLVVARFIPHQIRTLWRTGALFGLSAGGFLLLVRRKRNEGTAS